MKAARQPGPVPSAATSHAPMTLQPLPRPANGLDRASLLTFVKATRGSLSAGDDQRLARRTATLQVLVSLARLVEGVARADPHRQSPGGDPLEQLA